MLPKSRDLDGRELYGVDRGQVRVDSRILSTSLKKSQ